MSAVLDQIEERVNAVADLVRKLRREIARLEHELAERPVLQPAVPHPPPLVPVPPPPVDDGLLTEIARLRDERAVVRERVRSLIREIDQVAW
jgi:hypothetical protein